MDSDVPIYAGLGGSLIAYLAVSFGTAAPAARAA
jgi:hypothetical protein